MFGMFALGCSTPHRLQRERILDKELPIFITSEQETRQISWPVIHLRARQLLALSINRCFNFPAEACLRVCLSAATWLSS